MSPEQFYELSPVEFYYALQDYNERQTFFVHTQFEVMRMHSFMEFNMSRTRKQDQVKDIHRYMPLQWDRVKHSGKKQSVEEMKQLLMGIAQVSNSRKPKK